MCNFLSYLIVILKLIFLVHPIATSGPYESIDSSSSTLCSVWKSSACVVVQKVIYAGLQYIDIEANAATMDAIEFAGESIPFDECINDVRLSHCPGLITMSGMDSDMMTFMNQTAFFLDTCSQLLNTTVGGRFVAASFCDNWSSSACSSFSTLAMNMTKHFFESFDISHLGMDMVVGICRNLFGQDKKDSVTMLIDTCRKDVMLVASQCPQEVKSIQGSLTLASVELHDLQDKCNHFTQSKQFSSRIIMNDGNKQVFPSVFAIFALGFLFL